MTDQHTTDRKDGPIFGYHVVSIIDLLGQKDHLLKWADFPKDGQITPELQAAVDRSAGAVHWLSEMFVAFFKDTKECAMPETFDALSPEQQTPYRRFSGGEPLKERFSDTFLFHSPIANTHGDESILPLCRILLTCGRTMIGSLADRIPLRGAVTIGTGVMFDDGFYGPALAEAHHLENEIADSPRIVVSTRIPSFLDETRNFSQDPWIERVSRETATWCRRLLCTDIDGQVIVDFLGEATKETFRDRNKKEATQKVQKAYDFVCEEASRFRAEHNEKLTRRYDHLQEYMKSRLPLWDITP